MSGMAVATVLANPYPGLRPFDESEGELFFGRETHTDELLRRLGRSRFLAVVGTSGSGKSSLVRAGLLPALHGGGLIGASSHWRIAVFRPGGDPIGAMAGALYAAFEGPAPEDERVDRAMLATTLRRSSLGLAEVARQARLKPQENLLLVVDQFEEIFRFKQASASSEGGNQAAAFVRLLLEAARQSSERIHVLITMRSDFLGDCAEFRDLAETINDGLYLIPRLTRDQLRLAITGPAAVEGASLAPGLVQELLNGISDNSDQLPVLQHALMRTWERWTTTQGASTQITVEDYEAIGGVASALSRHANEALAELPDGPDGPNKDMARRLFQCLTERGPDNREVRRPTTLADLGRILEADRSRVERVIDCFRQEGRGFLMPPCQIPLHERTVIDIAHESLIRNWDTLRKWVEEEERSREIYVRLADAARLEALGQAGFWRDPQLQLALDWKQATRPNEAWARRYDPGFEVAMRFLEGSAAEREQARRRDRRRSVARRAAVSGGLVLSIAFGLVFAYQYRQTQAGQLASQSVLLAVQEVSALPESILRAVESMRRVGSLEANSALQLGLALLPEQVGRVNYEGPVTAVAWSPDGRALATASVDAARVTDLATGRDIVPPVQHAAAVLAVAWSSDGRYVITGSQDTTARLIDVTTPGASPRTVAHGDAVVAVAFSPDGRYVATGTGAYDRTVRLIEVASGKTHFRLKHDDGLRAVTFGPEGRYVATASWDKTARVWESSTGRKVARLEHGEAVFAVAWSADGRYVATGSLDKTARVMDVATGGEVSRLLHEEAVRAVAFSPDARHVATASDDHTARVMNAATGVEIWRFSHDASVLAVAWSPDGAYVATASKDHTARVLDAVSGHEVSRVPHRGSVQAVAFSRDGRYMATASSDKTARVLKPAQGQRLVTQGVLSSASFSRGGRYLATETGDGTVRVMSVAEGQEISRLPLDGSVVALTHGPAHQNLASGNTDGAIRVVDTTGREALRLKHEAGVLAMAFSPDGRYVATGNDDWTARVVDIATERNVIPPVTHEGRVLAVAFSLDGQHVATGSEAGKGGIARIIDLATSNVIRSFQHEDNVRAVAFSPDRRRLATGTEDNAVLIWDTVTGKVVTRLLHRKPINTVTFSPDGRHLATGTTDGRARVWDAVRWREILSVPHPGTDVLAVAFDDDGILLVVTTIKLYHYPVVGTHLIERARSRLCGYLTEAEWDRSFGASRFSVGPLKWRALFDGDAYGRTCGRVMTADRLTVAQSER